MEPKKILIIARAIYPAQFPRAYRATELATELARQGHEVILYALLGKYDYSLFEKDHNLKVKNIGNMWFATLNSDGTGRRNFIDKVLSKIFNRLIDFPDIELMFRIPAILRKEANIDFLISVAKPFTIHWGCALAKTISPANFPKVWAADCGDPYMGNRVTKKSPLFYFKYIEKWFCRKTDHIVIPIKEAIEGYYPEFKSKITVIPQGFNFDNLDIDIGPPHNKILTFSYSGIFYKGFRDPSMFLEYLCNIKKDFKFVIFTHDQSLLEPFKSRLKGKIEIRPYIPRHELLKILSKMDFLVNFENGTSVHSPSKLIDYALTKRPILSINNTILPLEIINDFFERNYNAKYIIEDIERYNIKFIAHNFLDLI